MSWKIAIVVALLTAFITAITSIIVTNYVADKCGVSDQDGGRSMGIFFFLGPGAFVMGLLFGLLVSYLMHAVEWAHFWKAVGASVGIALGAIVIIAGYFLLDAPIRHVEGGSPLVLEVEIHIPLERIPEHREELDPMRISLYAGPRDNSFGDIDTALNRTENGKLIVTGKLGLNSTSHTRTVSFHVDQNTWLALDHLPITAKPSEKDSAWSTLLPMRDATIAEAHYSDVQARVRVVKRVRVL
ncbi:MAG: hypothetical protein IPI00_15545 [Flavobacteriales bacterium]|nr:hypothetical protein [Flavobacteriales bacterium]MBK6945421.1 hypothetical protein [Flavobacteriales bacterium]MBK7241537.1 hypothetical protein [Flavobacteriales bacterium]MBK7298365.1 hypothetical protein [Flavobacteriales bacterium]MBP9139329.1 hypothetical protein [Flavobacteriales bacterium]